MTGSAGPSARSATSGLPMPARLYGLDVLRGIAALAVVFWHWQHFFIGGLQMRRWQLDQQPWYAPFSFLYRHGWLAVEVFFVLSGFVFYWLYAEALAARRVRLNEFFVARFSRLYPLHFLTLILVACGQWLYFRISGTSFVYPANDAYHFMLHLLFVPAWGFEQNASFNMPVWSVSVEVFLYAVFFLCCRLLPVRFFVLLALSAFGIFVLLRFNQPLGRGVGAFFLGGAAYLFCRRLVASRHAPLFTWLLGGSTLALWFLVAWTQFPKLSAGYFAFIGRHAFAYAAILGLTALSVAFLALTEAVRGPIGQRLALLGEISYASYLLHFPLQLAIVIGITAAGLPRDIFYAEVALVLYLAALILMSWLSFKYFERPAQVYLRRRFLTTKRE